MRGCLSGATPRLLSCGHRPHAQARYHNDEEASTTSVSRRVAAARRSKTWLLALSIGILAPAALRVAALALVRPAVALPSFARQTGFECAACHVAFPELTPTGRLFKLKGYRMQGGDSPLPPIAGFLLPAFTHTQAGQPGGLPPNFGANSNFALQQASLFYGGAISSDLGIGAFAQATYDSASNRVGWDNIDIRFARAGTIGDWDFVYGLRQQQSNRTRRVEYDAGMPLPVSTCHTNEPAKNGRPSTA
jgi:hypothetical protein